MVPKNLQILPSDNEETKAKKKRKIKSLKGKFRLMKSEQARMEKQNTWKKFADKKASKRKPGFMTGTDTPCRTITVPLGEPIFTTFHNNKQVCERRAYSSRRNR